MAALTESVLSTAQTGNGDSRVAPTPQRTYPRAYGAGSLRQTSRELRATIQDALGRLS